MIWVVEFATAVNPVGATGGGGGFTVHEKVLESVPPWPSLTVTVTVLLAAASGAMVPWMRPFAPMKRPFGCPVRP